MIARRNIGSVRVPLVVALGVLVVGAAWAYGFWRARSQRPAPPPPVAVAGKPIDEAVPDGKPEEFPATPQTEIPPGGAPRAAHHGAAPVLGADPLAGRNFEGPGPHEIGFDLLSAYVYATPGFDQKPEELPDQIPASIRALTGKKITAIGYILPGILDNGLAVQFLLLRNPRGCCYGVTPMINEWISVTVPEGSEGIYPDYRPVKVTGVFEVGETVEDGWVTGVYRMKDAAVEVLEAE